MNLAEVDVSPRIQQAFRDAVLRLVERRRLPCNISCINDIMRQEDRWGYIWGKAALAARAYACAPACSRTGRATRI